MQGAHSRSKTAGQDQRDRVSPLHAGPHSPPRPAPSPSRPDLMLNTILSSNQKFNRLLPAVGAAERAVWWWRWGGRQRGGGPSRESGRAEVRGAPPTALPQPPRAAATRSPPWEIPSLPPPQSVHLPPPAPSPSVPRARLLAPPAGGRPCGHPTGGAGRRHEGAGPGACRCGGLIRRLPNLVRRHAQRRAGKCTSGGPPRAGSLALPGRCSQYVGTSFRPAYSRCR